MQAAAGVCLITRPRGDLRQKGIRVPKTIVVEKGDCLINLSRQEGFYWETIWNHPQNAGLRRSRKHLNIIKKGDEVYVPDRKIKEIPSVTEQLHKFVRKGASVKFDLTLLDLGKPRANERYILIVDGVSREGCTDKNGSLSESIPPNARNGLLLLGNKQEEFTINFGHIDPIEEISGVKTRLRNLGFYHGDIDDQLDPETHGAIAAFQSTLDLSGEGFLDIETREALVEMHGS